MKHLHELENIPLRLQTQILEKVFKVAEFIAMTKEEKKNYEESLKNYNDLQNTLDTSEREGFEKGFTKGVEEITPLLEEAKAREEEAKAREEEAKAREEEERKQKEEAKTSLRTIIQKLISKGFSVEEIAEDLNKSIDEVDAIIKK